VRESKEEYGVEEMTTEIIGRIAGANLEKKQIVLSDKDGILKMYSYPDVLDVVAQKQKQGWYVKLTLDDAALIKKIEYAAKPEWAGPSSTKGNIKPRNEGLIVHQTTYKECCETARCLMLIPDGVFDEEEYNRLMDIALHRSIRDAKALIEAAGE